MFHELLPRPIESPRALSATDEVFGEMYRQVVELRLPPGTKVSELEVARSLGVSRQPVRDAFFRLSQLGFLTIRPQRATVISRISKDAVLQARFIRTALEVETARAAAAERADGDVAALEANLRAQADAIAADDRKGFHALDDGFHKIICAMSGKEFAWALIGANKAHMDRVRFLSLSSSAVGALEDHRSIAAAIRSGDVEAAGERMRVHLGRIEEQVDAISAHHPEYFAEIR